MSLLKELLNVERAKQEQAKWWRNHTCGECGYQGDNDAVIHTRYVLSREPTTVNVPICRLHGRPARDITPCCPDGIPR